MTLFLETGIPLRDLLLCGILGTSGFFAPGAGLPQDSPPAPPNEDRAPREQKWEMPSEADIQKAEKDAREVYGREYKLTDPAKRQEWGLKLLALASQVKNDRDAATKYVLLRDAAVFGGLDTAFSAADVLKDTFEDVDKVDFKADALAAAQKTARTVDELRSLAGGYCAVLDEVIRDEYAPYLEKLSSESPMSGASFTYQTQHSKRASGLIAGLKRIASKVSMEHVQRAAEYETQIRKLDAECKAAQKAMETLDKNPKDPSASLVYGKFLAGRDKWGKALEYLVNCTDAKDATLKEAAEQDNLTSPKNSEACIKTAENWENAAKKYVSDTAKFNARAIYWLRNAIAAAENPVTKARLEKKIESLLDKEAVTAGFYRAVNLNGPPLRINGNPWEGGDPPNFSHRGQGFENQDIPLDPPTDPERTRMIRSSVWDPGGSGVTMKGVPGGTYQVFLYVWEDTDSVTFDVSLNGSVVQAGVKSGRAGQWQKLGPWTVAVSDGKIEVACSPAAANLSGIEVHRTGAMPK